MAIKEHVPQQFIDEFAASLLTKDPLPKGSPIRVNEVNSDVLRELKPHYSDWRFLKKSDAKSLKPNNRLKFFVKDGKRWRDVSDGQQASRSTEWQAFVKPMYVQTSSGGSGASRSAVATANAMPSHFEPISLIKTPEALDTKTHWVEFNIFDEDGKPVEQELNYTVRFDDGTKIRSRLKDGTDYLTGVPLFPFTIEIIPGDELNQKLAELRKKLRTELDTAIAQVKANTARHEKNWTKIGNVEAGFIYLGAGLSGAGEWIVDTVKGVTELATGIVKANMATYEWTGKYINHRVNAFASYASGDTEGLKQSTHNIETMHKELGEDISEIGEHAETLALLAWDDETRTMLTDFPSDYFSELSGVERTRAVTRYGIDFLLIFVGGVGAGVLAIKNSAKISKLLNEMLALIKQLRFKQTVKKPKVDDTYTLGPKKKTSYSKVELDRNGKFRGEHNAGPNAPNYQKWTESGGTVKYDSATDTILYGKTLKTSRDKEYIEVPYKKGSPNDQRYPDFSKYSEQEVKINMSGKPEKDITSPDSGDFSKAWKALEKNKGSDEVAKYGIEKRTKGKRTGTYPDRNPENMTWHHVQDGETMQLLDSDIHSTFKHKGGASYSR